MLSTNSILFVLLLLAVCVACVLAVVIAEERLRQHRLATVPEKRAAALREYVAIADAETVCAIADALADRAKALIDARAEPGAFYVLSWVYSGLRPAQSVLRGFLRQRSLARGKHAGARP